MFVSMRAAETVGRPGKSAAEGGLGRRCFSGPACWWGAEGLRDRVLVNVGPGDRDALQQKKQLPTKATVSRHTLGCGTREGLTHGCVPCPGRL